MLLLIDAYNLLHHSDVMHRDRSEQWLARARQRLVRTLADHLDPRLAAETYLVFDARMPPPERAARYVQHSIHLMFAVDHEEADDLIEELIARHPTPKRLAVVSSDHRIQRAAKRRSAAFFDADQWYDRLVEQGPSLAIPWPPRPEVSPDAVGDEKPQAPQDEHELRAWVDKFTSAPPKSRTPRRKSRQKPAGSPPSAPGTHPPATDPAASPPEPARSRRRAARKDAPVRPEPDASGGKPDPHRALDPELANPFPEGYAEDLLTDDDSVD